MTGVELMDNQGIFQMILPLLPSLPRENQEMLYNLQEAVELQQLILAHASQAGRRGSNWRLEMLRAIKPKMPERNQHMMDVLIKSVELVILIEKGRTNHGHRSTF
ncbi:MAG: hypothetical protein FWC91_12710 [Defluviitaleaceae bacterium]|nr:hypothetical protein [Defluviitaleaceae bacterium]